MICCTGLQALLRFYYYFHVIVLYFGKIIDYDSHGSEYRS